MSCATIRSGDNSMLAGTRAMRMGVISAAAVTATLALVAAGPARADMAIYMLVNDTPISEFDVDRRTKELLKSSPVLRRKLKSTFADKKALNKRFTQYAQKTDPKAVNALAQLRKIRPRSQAEADQLKAAAAKVMKRIQQLQKKFGQSLEASVRASVAPSLRSRAVKDLVNETLQAQAVKKASVTVSQSRVDGFFASIAKRNKKSPEEFSALLRKEGTSPKAYKDRLRTRLAWNRVVSQRYGRQVSVASFEIDEQLQQSASESGGAEKTLQLDLTRLTLGLKGRIDQAVMANRYAEAEAIRARFNGCESIATARAQVAGVSVDRLGRRKLSDVSAPVRPLLKAARAGQMIPPMFTERGVELYAVCERRRVASTMAARKQAEDQVRAKQMSNYSERFLRDLCNDAVIEYRSGDPVPGGKPCG